MRYGIILAAGNQSRFSSDIPKALGMLNGKCLLDINIEHMSRYVDEVYLVTSTSNNFFFEDFKDKVNILTIESGFGCGDAVLKSLSLLDLQKDDSVFLIWGDSVQNNNILYEECLNNYNNFFIIPLEYQNNPYVDFILSNNKVKNILFTKYGNIITEGHHDYSLFYFNGLYVKSFLVQLYNKYFNIQQNSYSVPNRKNELLFLDLFNLDLNIDAEVVIIENVSSNNSFNTIDELNKLNKGI